MKFATVLFIFCRNTLFAVVFLSIISSAAYTAALSASASISDGVICAVIAYLFGGWALFCVYELIGRINWLRHLRNEFENCSMSEAQVVFHPDPFALSGIIVEIVSVQTGLNELAGKRIPVASSLLPHQVKQLFFTGNKMQSRWPSIKKPTSKKQVIIHTRKDDNEIIAITLGKEQILVGGKTFRDKVYKWPLAHK